MATLYELSHQFYELLNLAQSGVIDKETLEDTIESLDLRSNFNNKVKGYVHVIKELESNNKALREEEKRLAERRRSQEKNITNLKNILLDTMKLTEQERVDTGTHKVSIRKSPLKLKIVDEKHIPKEFYTEQAPKLNRKELLKYAKENEVKGIELKQSEGVMIR